jgi:hypothetical protein
VQADDPGHRAGFAIAKMAMHGIAHHHAQVLDGITLSGDGMAKSSCDNAAIHLVFTHLKNDFIDKRKIARRNGDGQGAI